MRTLHPLGFIALWHLGCAGNSSQTDAARDNGADTPSECAEILRSPTVFPARVYVSVGGSQTVALRLSRDRLRCPATFALRSDLPVVELPERVTITPPHAEALFDVRGLRAGVTTVTVEETTDTQHTTRVTFTVNVRSGEAPTCPAEATTTRRALYPGGRVQGAEGGPLAAASVAMPTAATFAREEVTLGCAPDQIPMGYVALGPAVRFSPQALRLPREVPFTVPVNPVRIPALFELRLELAYSAPGVSTRVVPVADARLTEDGRSVSFMAPRLGTWQAVLREGTGTHRVHRRFVWRAILGISMGAVGSSMIGARHPELFDAIVPLGGPADAGFSGDYLKRFVFGGFCTAVERARIGDLACAGTSSERTPSANDIGEVTQSFESFYAAPGRGTGGTFDRRARFQGFRDIARMFGNPAMFPDPANGVLPLGVPAAELTRTDQERCAHPVSLGGPDSSLDARYYDDEFNPEGTHPAITFCDGNSATDNPGRWAGGPGSYPTEILLAIDLNHNGLRDAGEPVVRDFSEPFSDVGGDGIESAHEAGYDPISNPDPAGDDYDRQFNPAGEEGNFLHDTSEPWDDTGMDGVPCPKGRRCIYDFGEGNGRFDTVASAFSEAPRLNPRSLYAALPPAEASRLAVWADGGVRDALQFGVNANHFVGAVAQQNVGLHYFNSFSALSPGVATSTQTEESYRPQGVDFSRLPTHAMLRYGSIDATAQQIEEGDGAHVGTTQQIFNRLMTAMFWTQARWPNGDRAVFPIGSDPDNAGRCANGYTCTFEFTSPRAHRTGPVSIYLPPGYHLPENQDITYPVVFFLHGYGMQSTDLAASGYIVGQQMASGVIAEWQRPAKFIMVFPDGRCRAGDGCLEGTFYVDSPAGNGQVETYFLDLYDFVSRTYRARPPSDAEVLE